MSFRRFFGAVLVVSMFGCCFGGSESVGFKSGKAVWLEGRELEKNVFAGFRAVFDKPGDGKVILKLAGSSVYRVYLNGEFVGHGPAIAAHGYYRVDEWGLDKYLKDKANILAIEVAGYNVNSFYLLDQASFLQAEVLAGDKVVVSTAGEGGKFAAMELGHRVQKVQRYSFQRPFIEYYKMRADFDDWKVDSNMVLKAPVGVVKDEKKLLERRVSYPDFEVVWPVKIVAEGGLKRVEVEKPWRDRTMLNIGPKLKGYKIDELEEVISDTADSLRSVGMREVNEPFKRGAEVRLKDDSFEILDFGSNLSGFVGLEVRCGVDCKLMVTFDEILREGDVDFKRLSCVNAVTYELKKGNYKLESLEPYTMRYMKINVLEGRCQVVDPYLRLYENPDCGIVHFSCDDERLNKIYKAAVNTFKQNAIDVFMDCPSRERAGWLCDSYRTAQSEYCLTGKQVIEYNFLENYMLAEEFKCLPEGMIAMCYPSDHYDGCFIPNWAMWFVLELEAYKNDGGDAELIKKLEPRVMGLVDYFKKFENPEGMLENLESWVFVDWSAANNFTKGVNYPTNMLYAAMLRAVGELYGGQEYFDQARKLRHDIAKQSFNGRFFIDNAVRNEEGWLKATENCSESCQYYAFYFDVADLTRHGELWEKLVHNFGRKRAQTKAFPNVEMGNALLGNWMRVQLFSRYGLYAKLREEIVEQLFYMADRTNTLWEHVGDYASCNHGFASHVVCSLFEDMVGIDRVDCENKTVTLKFTDSGLQSCIGQRPTKAGVVLLNWRVKGDSILYKTILPEGYKVVTNNLTGKKLVRQ